MLLQTTTNYSAQTTKKDRKDRKKQRADRGAKPLGSRKLLLHKNEIHKLAGRTEAKGLTVIPLRIYFRDGIAKCEIALAQGKKTWDRRQDERNKEARKEADQAMYRNRRR